MFIGLVVSDGDDKFENMVNGDGKLVGWELEMVDLLCFIKWKCIRDVVWFIVDVYYIVVYYYDLN